MRLWLAIALVGLTLAPARARADEGEAIPRYVVERVEVRGNRRTATRVVLGAVLVKPGDTVSADDARLEASRFRLLGLGQFYDVRLRLERGRARGLVVVVVEVVERGTLLVHELWWGVSQAIEGWGGVDLAETNFAGQGLTVSGAALVTNAPDMPGGHVQQAYRLRFVDGRIGKTPLSLGGSILYDDASEPYRTSGGDDDARPSQFTAVRYQRIGGTAGLGVELRAFTRLSVDYRYERILAEVPRPLVRHLPDGSSEPVDVGLVDGGSSLSMLSFAFERDTRADPFLTPAGSRLVLSNELGSRAIGGSYDFFKLTLSYQEWIRLRWGHVLSLGGLVGVIVGDAPIFERYYLGDLDPLVPARALGLQLSTLPARNLLHSGIARERYAPLAARVVVEYAVPLFRGGRQVYGGDVFFDVGLIGLATYDDLRGVNGGGWKNTPIDLLVDVGIRLDTVIGTFNLTLGNTLSRVPY